MQARKAGQWRNMSESVKRIFDFFVAALALLILSPVIAVVALFVRVFLGAPVFFVQERPGKDGRLFRMIKFRTMKNAVDRHGHPLPDEKRMTKFGSFLRKASLDELPELINVLRGEMSLVGPRPLLPKYLDLYTPTQARRHDVLPGVTGWAQINGRNALSWDEKFTLDVWYVENRSFWLDLTILFRTVQKVVLPSGVSQDGHVTMQAFDRVTSSRIALVGAGGHAKVVLDTLQAAGQTVDRVYDDNPDLQGKDFCGIPVVGPIDQLQECPGQKAIIAIGDCRKRRELAETYDCHWITAIHPNAYVAPSAEVGAGSLIAAGAVVQAAATVGDHVIVNTGATVDHDCHIDDFAHLCPGTNLGGNVTVGSETMCGLGSRLLPGVTVGTGAMIGAGSVVNRPVADGSTVLGIPARPVPIDVSKKSQAPKAA